jgi:hypothetical protein
VHRVFAARTLQSNWRGRLGQLRRTNIGAKRAKNKRGRAVRPGKCLHLRAEFSKDFLRLAKARLGLFGKLDVRA